MRTANNNLSIVLVAAIGAAATWLWINRGVDPAAPAAARTQVVSDAQPAPAPDLSRRQSEKTGESAKVAPAPSAAPAAPATAPVPHADSTYQSMLVAAQTKPDNPRTERDLIQERERFLATADDPDWARRTEQALWNYLQAKTPAGVDLGVTSISCRSEGCEVQAMPRPNCPTCPAPPGVPPGVPGNWWPPNADPISLFRGDWPGGLPLRRQLLIGQFVGDGGALVITYSREDPPSAQTAP